MTDFEYDVAFSFHSQDQGLAVQLNDRLQERFRTFIYTEQQKMLAGTDGEITFNKVFGSSARVVVVLYRKEWGETPFTRTDRQFSTLPEQPEDSSLPDCKSPLASLFHRRLPKSTARAATNHHKHQRPLDAANTSTGCVARIPVRPSRCHRQVSLSQTSKSGAVSRICCFSGAAIASEI